MIKRYDHYPHDMEEIPKGEYVIFEDYESELKIMKEQKDNMVKASNQNYAELCDALKRIEKLIKGSSNV